MNKETTMEPEDTELQEMLEGRYMVDIGFACLGNPGPAAWVAVIVGADGSTKTIQETVPNATNAAIAARAFLGVLLALPKKASGEVRCRDKTGVETINEFLSKWKANGWRNAAKKPVANRDLWMRVSGALEGSPDLAFTWNDGTTGAGSNVEEAAGRLAAAEKARLAL